MINILNWNNNHNDVSSSSWHVTNQSPGFSIRCKRRVGIRQIIDKTWKTNPKLNVSSDEMRSGGGRGVLHGRRSFLRKVRVDLGQREELEVQITSKGVFPLLLVIVFEAPASTRTWKHTIKLIDAISDMPLLHLTRRTSLRNEVEYPHTHPPH